MNNYYTHLKSDIPCTIYANGEYIGVCEKRKSIDLLASTNNIYFNVSPVGNYYPYTIHIQNEYKCIDTTNSSIVVPFINNHFDIYLKNIKIYENISTTTLLHTTFNKSTITILNGTSSMLNIYDNGIIVYSDNLKLLSKATASSRNGNIIIKGYSESSDEYYLLILNSNYTVIYSGYFDNLEENNNKLVGFTNVCDMAKHAHICEIDISNIEHIEDYYMSKDSVDLCNIPELVPNAFLEAIKVQNFSLCKKYLSNTLSKASNSHFKTFFGEIQSIYYNQYNNSSPINYTVYNGEYKSYSFRVENNEIVDIEEYELYSASKV